MSEPAPNDTIEHDYKALKSCQDDLCRKKIQSSLAEVHAQRGHERYKVADYEGAIKEYSRAREQNPEHYPAINQLGMCFLNQKDFEKAITSFQEIINRIHYSQTIYKASYIEDFNDEFDALLAIADMHIQQNFVGSLRKAFEHIQLAKQLCRRYGRTFSESQTQEIMNLEHDLEIQKEINKQLFTINEYLTIKNWRGANNIIEQFKQQSHNHSNIIAFEKSLNDAISTEASGFWLNHNPNVLWLVRWIKRSDARARL